MKLRGLLQRIEPLTQKLAGSLPLCPWSSIGERFNPGTLGGIPPALDIQTMEENGALKKLRFASRHDFWFPKETPISADLWSEWLSVFWAHSANGHYYLSHGTPVRPGDICIDCGACEGFFAAQALEAGAAKVVCIEPGLAMVQALERTFAEEIKSGRVIIQHAAVGATEGTASFSFDEAQPFIGRIGSNEGAASSSITLTTLTGLASALGLPRVDFIKMDIEGAEIQAVEGAMPLLRSNRPRLALTTYHRPYDFAVLKSMLIAAGYRHVAAAGLTDRAERVYRPVMIHAH